MSVSVDDLRHRATVAIFVARREEAGEDDFEMWEDERCG